MTEQQAIIAFGYSITTNQADIAAMFRVMNRNADDLPPIAGRVPGLPGTCCTASL
jgi:hypothetical protein